MATQFATQLAALINVWNSGALPSGVTGTTFNPGDAAATKIAAIATWTVSAPAKALLAPTQINNAIVPADYAALTSTQLQFVACLLAGAQVDASVGTTVRTGFMTIFAGKTTTLTQLGALVAPFDNARGPWWQSAGLPWSPTIWDAVAAGLAGNATMWTWTPRNKRRDAGSKNIFVDILYAQVGADGTTVTGVTVTDANYGATDLTDARVAQQALGRITATLLPGDAALAALTAG